MVAFDERRQTIVAALNALPGFTCLDPAGRILRISKYIRHWCESAKSLQKRFLEEAGVATVAGPSFGVHADDYIRFFLRKLGLEIIVEAISRIKAIL